jgi:hypothetical protein
VRIIEASPRALFAQTWSGPGSTELAPIRDGRRASRACRAIFPRRPPDGCPAERNPEHWEGRRKDALTVLYCYCTKRVCHLAAMAARKLKSGFFGSSRREGRVAVSVKGAICQNRHARRRAARLGARANSLDSSRGVHRESHHIRERLGGASTKQEAIAISFQGPTSRRETPLRRASISANTHRKRTMRL